MDSIDILRVFQRVVELGAFTRAAESLGLSKASVSNAVQQLEASVGTQLLYRTTRRVQLTADGSTFYERSRDLINDMDELRSMFQRNQSQLRGRLRVDMPGGLARGLVIPHLADFLTRHPLLEVEISGTDRIVDVVREGFDCVLRIGPLDDTTLVARSLGHMPTINCASPTYLVRRGTPKTLDDLAAHDLIHYVGTLGQRSSGFEYYDGERYRNLAMGGPITVNSSDAYNAAALAGLGIIQPPAIGVRSLIAEGRLVEILPDLPAEPMRASLLYPQRRHLPHRVAAFMGWLTDLLVPYLEPLPTG